MTKSKWQRWFVAPIMAALLLTSFAPAVMAAPPAVITQAEKVSEVTGTLAGGQFAKIWLGLKPENPGTVTVTSVWDRSDVDVAGLGFFILDPDQLTAVYSGGRLPANNIAAGSQGFFLNGPTNTQGGSFRATGPDYSVVVYNDSSGDASFVLKVTNAFIIDEGDQVKPVGAVAEAAEAAPAAEAAAPTAEAAAPVPAAAAPVAPAAAATTAAAAAPAAVAEVQTGPLRAQEVQGELNEQYSQHYLGLVPNQRDGNMTLTLTFDPQDNAELARRINFWVLDDAGFKSYQAGESASSVAVAAGSREEANTRSANLSASGFGPYTVLVYNNSRVPATYSLVANGGVLIDDANQTTTSQAVSTTVAAPATAPAAAAVPAAGATEEAAGRAGEPGGTYTVKPGDTLALIARDIYGDYRRYEELCAFNNIANCDVIEVGDVIKLPTEAQINAGVTAAPAAAAPAAATPAATVEAAAATTTTAVTTTATTTTTTTTAAPVTTTGTTTTTAAAPVTTTTTTTGTTTTKATATGSIVDVAKASGNFKTLVAALQKAGLDTALADAGPFTVFAPTDAAFDALLSGNNLTVDQLLQAKELADILKYHVLSGEVMSGDVTNGLKASTLQGKQVTFEVKNGKVFINGAEIVTTDIPAENGVIHAIDAVILPPAP